MLISLARGRGTLEVDEDDDVESLEVVVNRIPTNRCSESIFKTSALTLGPKYLAYLSTL